jgi:tungstate transport system permease protein
MNFLLDSLSSAILLTFSFDRELFSIVLVSLQVSGVSTVLASLMGVPLGFLIAFEKFKGKQLVITCLNTLLAVPTVVIGLFVYVFISRRGIFGPMDLLYTKKAIVIGQTFLILPLVATLTIAAVIRIDGRYRETAMTLGANRLQTAWVVVREARFALIAAVIAAFGRVVSEVGISMMLGGNAKGFTRTMTTAMALEYDKGEFVLAVALGIILLLLAFGMNLLFNFIQGRTDSR